MFAEWGTPATTPLVGSITPDQIPHAHLRDLYAYWAARVVDGRPPPRSAIDPVDLKVFLPNLLILEQVPAGARHRYRYRLSGTAITRIVGRELTGLSLQDALPDPYLSYVVSIHDLVVNQQRPVYSETLYHDLGNFVNGMTYRLALPLCAEPPRGPMVLVSQHWIRRSEKAAGQKDDWGIDWRSAKPVTQIVMP